MDNKDSQDTEQYYKQVQEAAQYVREKLGAADIALVLGSGLNGLTKLLTDPKELKYSEIPHMPQTAIVGHAGVLIRGTVDGRPVFFLAGRVHAYEGYHMYQLSFSARMMSLLGVKVFMATNAAGGAMPGMWPGCIMRMTDHVNLFRRSILGDTFEHGKLGSAHIPLDDLYSHRIGEIAHRAAEEAGIKLFQGVYGCVSGPCYETHTEVKYPAHLGIDAFGMSTIPECSAAKALGMEVFALSLITNLAAGMTEEILSHSDVTEVADKSGPAFSNFMLKFISEITISSPTITPPPSLYERKSRVTPLPIVPKPQANSTEMHEAVTFVRHKLEYSDLPSLRPDIAVVLSTGHDDFEKGVKGSVSLHLSDIPHFPVVSGSGAFGTLICGSFGHTKILVFSKLNIEEFSCEEGVFIAELLYELGITRLFTTLTGGYCSDETLNNSIVYLTDCFDYGGNYPVAHRTRSQILGSTRHLSTRLLAAAKKLDTGVKEGSYVSFYGPALPTPTEIKIIANSGVSISGITQLNHVYAARAFGIEVFGLAGVTYSARAPSKTGISNSSAVPLISLLSQLIGYSDITYPTSLPIIKRRNEDAVSLDQVSYQLTPPIGQGSFNDVKQAADFLRQHVSDISVAIIVDSGFDITKFAELSITNEIPYVNVPFASKHLTGKFVIATLQSKTVLFLVGTQRLNEGRNAAETSFNTRILFDLGISLVLILGEVAGCTETAKLEEFVIGTDHANISARNPLYGPNEHRWGLRFCDMSGIYDLKLREVVHQIDSSIRPVRVGYVIGPIFNSPLHAKAISTLGSEVLTTAIIPEVTIAKHSGGLRVAFVGVVSTLIAQPTDSSDDVSAAFSKLNIDSLASHTVQDKFQQLITKFVLQVSK